MKRICVIGFGKIGQGIAANMIRHGYRVTAVDRDPDLRKAFEEGTYMSSEPGVGSLLAGAYRDGRLQVFSNIDEMRDPEAVVLCLPLLIDEEKKTVDEPFLSSLTQLAPYCRDQLLLVVETTVPVGYCRDFILPALAGKGKIHGVDFLLAHSPERIKSGTMLRQLEQVPKVIGGIDEQATERAYTLYQGFFDKELLYRVESIEAAELLKLAGMIYRDVNIALSNQLAMFAGKQGIDFSSLLPLINTDGEARLLQPGIGVGGHCTPVYPYFLINNFNSSGLRFRLAEESRFINESMASYAYSLVKDQVKERTALVLGLSFRPGVREDANSPGAQLYSLLKKEGFKVTMHDAAYPAAEIIEKGYEPGDPAVDGAALVFLTTMHPEYNDLDFKLMFSNGTRHLVDGRNMLNREKVREAGITYTGIGH